MANAADRKSIRAAEKAAKLAESNRRQVLVGIMSTVPGREWVWNQLERRNIFSSTYDDLPGRMAFLEGQRAAGLDLLADVLAACPDEFTQALREANARRTESDTIDADQSAAAGERPGSEEPGREPEGQPDGERDGEVGDGVEARLQDLRAVYQGGEIRRQNGANRRA